MNAAVANTPMLKMKQGILKAPWIQMASWLLLVLFLGVLFVNLTLPYKFDANEVSLQFSVLNDEQQEGSLFEIANLVRAESPQTILRTHLNETPYWLYINLAEKGQQQNKLIFFRSRHVVQSSCWHEDSAGQLTEMNLQSNRARTLSSDLHGYINSVGVLCRFSFIGPASLEVGLQTQEAFYDATLLQEQRQGFLEGVMYFMIGMVAVAAIMTRRAVFVWYGFWLFASLRLVALSEGWDSALFGIELRGDALAHARMMALAMYFASTVFMMSHLFDNVRRESWFGVLRGLQASSIFLLVLAVSASYRTFLELFWPMSLLAAFVVAWVVIQYFAEKRDRVAIYYFSAMLITLTGAVAEVLAAWFDHTFLLQYFNSASVTVLASAMTTVALAEFLRKAQCQQQLAAEEVKLAHDRLESVFNIAPSAMFTCSRDGTLLHFNKQFTDSFLNRDGVPTLDFLQPARLAAVFNFLGDSGKTSRRELPILLGNGQTRWFELVVSRDQQELVGVVSDFTARKDRELALQYQATHDELTGALNRRGLQHCIHNRLAKEQCSFTFFCLDIQQFSRLISAYGLAVSDQLLRAFYTELYKHLGTHGEIARLHVDHFVVLVQPNEVIRAEELFEAFLDRLDKLPFQLEGRNIQTPVLATIVYQGVIDNVLDAMETVEVSMLEAKLKAKRNSNIERVVFEQNQTRRLLEQSRTIRGLSDHRLPAGLTLAWQPILSLAEGEMPLYAEALLRIKSDDGQLRSAGFLLEACERGGHTAFLDNWVLSQSLDFLRDHADELQSLNVLSINVSPGSLNDEAFLHDTLALIQAHQSQASRLCLEITEVGSVINLQAVQQFIEQVRSLGVRIALDDFGAGYSNFRYAIDLHADVIKIDGSIIKNICHSTESHAVTTAILGLAHDLGCKCVAEWVEDLHTLREVKELGMDYVQGYLVSPAVECSRFLNLNSPLELLEDDKRVAMIQDVLLAAEGC